MMNSIGIILFAVLVIIISKELRKLKKQLQKNKCLDCGKEWNGGIYCPKCAKKLPDSGSCQIGCE